MLEFGCCCRRHSWSPSTSPADDGASTAQTSAAVSLDDVALVDLHFHGSQPRPVNGGAPQPGPTSSNDKHSVVPAATAPQSATTSNQAQVFALARAAVFSGDRRLLGRLFGTEHWLPNAADEWGRAPLVYAAMADRHSLAKWMLRQGCLPTAADLLGRCALHWAAQKDALATLRVLLGRLRADERAAAALLADSDGVTPLHLAARLKRPHCLQLLLKSVRWESRWRTVCVDSAGRSPLHWAVKACRVDNVRVLARANLDVAQADASGRTPLAWAATCNSSQGVECLRVLLETAGWSVGTRDRTGTAPLHLAVAADNAAAVRLLLDERAVCADVFDNHFRTPLHLAARFGFKDMAELLLKRGARLQRDNAGATALHYAAMHDHVETLDSIVTLTQRQDPLDSEGRSAFFWAVAGGARQAAVRLLAVTDVDRQARDRHGATALHLAAQLGRADAVQLLLDKGWSTRAVTLGGQSALSLAAARGHWRVVAALLRAGAEPGRRDADGRSPLHWAALGGHAYLCQRLVRLPSVEPNSADAAGRTALHAAASAGARGCVAGLLRAGADAARADSEALTPLHLAAARGRADVVGLLVAAGCPVNAIAALADGRRVTPTDVAAAEGRQALVDVLRAHGGMRLASVSNLAASIIQSSFRGYQRRAHP